jgi:hypothetical protein
MKSPIVSLTAILLVATATQSAIAAEVRFPQIKTECKTYFQARQPINRDFSVEGSFDGPRSLSEEEEAKIRSSLSDLFRAKQWDAALVEIEKISPSQLRDQVSIELIESMSQAKEMDRALRLLLQIFPEKTSHEQAKGIGIVAKHMALNDQFPHALETLKLLSDNDKWHLTIGVVPIIRVILVPTEASPQLATSEQLKKIRSVVELFPKASQREDIWKSIGEVIPLLPEVAQQISGLTSDPNLKLSMLESSAKLWFKSYLYSSYGTGGTQLKYGAEIANSIDNCVVRSRVFLELPNQIFYGEGLPYQFEDFSRKFAILAKSYRMLDQIESLLNAIDQDQIGDRRIVLSQKLALVELNTKFGRSNRSLELLAQLMNEQKQLQFNADRAEILLEIAPYYEKLNRRRTAIQVLEAAEVAIQLAYDKNEDAFSGDGRQGESRIQSWREQTLDSIGYQYRDLNQLKKVTELKRSGCTVLSPEDLSRAQKLINAGALSASTLRVPGFLCSSL